MGNRKVVELEAACTNMDQERARERNENEKYIADSLSSVKLHQKQSKVLHALMTKLEQAEKTAQNWKAKKEIQMERYFLQPGHTNQCSQSSMPKNANGDNTFDGIKSEDNMGHVDGLKVANGAVDGGVRGALDRRSKMEQRRRDLLPKQEYGRVKKGVLPMEVGLEQMQTRKDLTAMAE